MRPIFHIHYSCPRTQRALFISEGFGRKGTRLAPITERNPKFELARSVLRDAVHIANTTKRVDFAQIAAALDAAYPSLTVTYVPGDHNYASRVTVFRNEEA